MSIGLLRDRLAGAGLGAVATVERALGGFAAKSALVRLPSGQEVFAGTYLTLCDPTQAALVGDAWAGPSDAITVLPGTMLVD